MVAAVTPEDATGLSSTTHLYLAEPSETDPEGPQASTQGPGYRHPKERWASTHRVRSANLAALEECKEEWATRTARGDADADDHLEASLQEQRATYRAAYPRVAASGPPAAEDGLPYYEGINRHYEPPPLPREEEQAELLPRSFGTLKQAHMLSGKFPIQDPLSRPPP